MTPVLLVIDDDDLIAEMVRYALKPLLDSITLHIAADLSEDLIRLSPTMILTDLKLAHSSGEETLALLRGYFPTTPIIPMSGVRPSAMSLWEQKYQLSPFLSKDDLLTGLHPIVKPLIQPQQAVAE